jgi:hypothetical protein
VSDSDGEKLAQTGLDLTSCQDCASSTDDLYFYGSSRPVVGKKSL